MGREEKIDIKKKIAKKITSYLQNSSVWNKVPGRYKGRVKKVVVFTFFKLLEETLKKEGVDLKDSKQEKKVFEIFEELKGFVDMAVGDFVNSMANEHGIDYNKIFLTHSIPEGEENLYEEVYVNNTLPTKCAVCGKEIYGGAHNLKILLSSYDDPDTIDLLANIIEIFGYKTDEISLIISKNTKDIFEAKHGLYFNYEKYYKRYGMNSVNIDGEAAVYSLDNKDAGTQYIDTYVQIGLCKKCADNVNKDLYAMKVLENEKFFKLFSRDFLVPYMLFALGKLIIGNKVNKVLETFSSNIEYKLDIEDSDIEGVTRLLNDIYDEEDKGGGEDEDE